jgi:hypothetical protein
LTARDSPEELSRGSLVRVTTWLGETDAAKNVEWAMVTAAASVAGSFLSVFQVVPPSAVRYRTADEFGKQAIKNPLSPS